MNRFLTTAVVILKDPKAFLSRTIKLYDYYFAYGQLKETFVSGEYYWLYKKLVPNTTVVDIGANIGDTAIYFAQNNNVDKVLAFELIPDTYHKAKENVGMSPLKGKIQLFNKGISGKREKVFIQSKFKGYGSSTLVQAKAKTGDQVEILALNDVIKGKKNVAIKSDCEGSEEFIFDNADLSGVYAVMLEYHDYLHKKVLKVLSSKGFKVEMLSGPNELGRGLIIAWRGKK